MKTFRDHLKEEVVPTALSNGSVDIKNPAVRAELNGILAAIATRSCITPYIALTKMRKALSYFHIELPSKVYMEGNHGVEVWEIHQFGHKMGMTDQGEFVKEVPCDYYLFFHYHLFGSMFMIDARVVDKDDLDKRLSAAEAMIKEDAAAMKHLQRALAPKEKMHSALGDCDCSQGDSPSTKSAVDVSMRRKDKKLSADSLDEGWVAIAPRGQSVYDKFGDANPNAKWYGRKPPKANKPGDAEPGAGDTYKGSKQGGKTRFAKKTVKEENLDEVSLGKLVAYKNKAGEGREKGVALADKKMKGKAKVGASAPKHPYMEETVEEGKKVKIKLNPEKKIGYTVHDVGPGGKKTLVKSGETKVKDIKEGRMPASVIKHKQKLAGMTDAEKKAKFAGKSEAELKAMARRHGHGPDSNEYSKHGSYEKKQIDELSYETVARYHRKAADRYQTGEEPYEKRKKGRELATRKRAGGMMGIPKAKVMAKEETINEKLTKRMKVSDVISDFVHSDDPKFKGKSKKERMKMALGAYYGMHPEKSRKE
jgi:hypothetical protein